MQKDQKIHQQYLWSVVMASIERMDLSYVFLAVIPGGNMEESYP